MIQSTFLKFWNSAAGPKTIHFWAPAMKWGLVIAGLSDLQKPANQLSLSQNLSLGVSGIIWTRYGFVVLPKNYMIAGVNFFVFLIGTAQVGRILTHRQTIQANAKDTAQVMSLA